MLNLQVHLLTFYMLFLYFSENYKQYNFFLRLDNVSLIPKKYVHVYEIWQDFVFKKASIGALY